MVKRRKRRKMIAGELFTMEMHDQATTYPSGRVVRNRTMFCVEIAQVNSIDLRPFFRDLVKRKIITSWRGNHGISYKSVDKQGNWVQTNRYWIFCKYQDRKRAKVIIGTAVKMLI